MEIVYNIWMENLYIVHYFCVMDKMLLTFLNNSTILNIWNGFHIEEIDSYNEKRGGRMLEFDSGGYESISIFAERLEAGEGWICLEGPSGKEQQIHMKSDWYRQVQLALPEEGAYRIRQKGVAIVQLYLSGGRNLMERGVKFLEPDSGKDADLGTWYDTPYREQYHFSPFMNWVNDPNGLCWFKGYYHLFYQANPFGQKWNDMYWGHAVSSDLIHWVHMPHVLEPQPSLWKDRERKGGAFSGSAQVTEAGDEIRLYLTRHDGPQEDGKDTREWQTEAVCRDGIHVEKERPCITDKPAGASYDFRDPKVQRLGNTDYMVLGASVNGVASILLYGLEEDGWRFRGPLLEEHEPGIRTFECPDFFELDGKHVAAGAWMCHHDEANRYQMTRCYIGDFDGGKFQAEGQQWYDFGSNFYAAQTFEHNGRRIAIGWISDFYGEHRIRQGGAYGSFSLPRELHVKDGRLFTEPARECFELLKEPIYIVPETAGAAEEQPTHSSDSIQIPQIRIPGNAFYVKIRLEGDQDFRVTVAKEGDDTLSLERKDGITSLVSTRKEVEQVRFPSDVRDVRQAEIFVDRRVTEVYLNHGEAAGTKLFYQEGMDGYLEAEFPAGELKQFEVWTMESIWNHKS